MKDGGLNPPPFCWRSIFQLKTSLFEGGGPPDSFSHGCAVPAPSKRELFGRVISRLGDKSRIARPRFVQNLLNYCCIRGFEKAREG